MMYQYCTLSSLAFGVMCIQLYEKHYLPVAAPPFVISYYLLVPENYDPAYKYPLVLALRGVSDYVYGGIFLASPEFRKRYPAFVVIPIVSKRSVWAETENKSYALPRKGIKFPDAVPQAVSAIRKVQSKYTIDPDRIYVTGHSMGGIGAFGALASYPDVFAAGLVVSGLWDPMKAPALYYTPVWALHGEKDRQIPAKITKQLMRNVRDIGGSAQYTEIPKGGHHVWKLVYSNQEVWDWLFSQK